ncbi:hypothetical protein K2X85_00005, partial [bacterium]|nr:hypothetical protein [bacterium]
VTAELFASGFGREVLGLGSVPMEGHALVLDELESVVHAGVRDRLRTLDEASSKLDREGSRLAVEIPLPSLVDLQRQRRQRDEYGQQIRHSIASNTLPDQSLLDAFFSLVMQTDSTADLLREHADHVARMARIMFDKENLQAEQRHLDQNRSKQEAILSSINARWVSLWEPTGLPAGSASEMLDKRRVGEEINKWIDARQDSCHTLETLRQRRQTFLAQVDTIVGLPGSKVTRFQDAVRIARQRVDKETRRTTAEAQLTRQAQELREEESVLQADIASIDRLAKNWESSWRDLLDRVGLDRATLPAEAMEAVRLQRQQAEIERDLIDRQRRIDGIDHDATLFADRLASWDSSVPALTQRLASSREQQVRRQELHQQLDQCHREQEALSQDRLRVDARWKGLLEEAVASAEEELPIRMNQADEYREYRQEYEQIERQLAPMLAALPDRRAIEQIESISIDDLEERSAEVSSAVDAAQAELSLLDQTLGSLRADQKRIDGQAEGAERAEQMQGQLAALQVYVHQYLQKTIAGHVLDQTMERYRRENEGTLLARAGVIFRQLTCGSFERLDVEFDDHARPYLVGIRPGSTVPFDVKFMSEGTADQLYLSVRLAAIEKHAMENEPIPLLVDDILVNFDDDRSAATFRVLAELARRTQIIFFTHHAHLVDIARSVLPEDVLFVHDLEPRMASDDLPPSVSLPSSRRSKR